MIEPKPTSRHVEMAMGTAFSIDIRDDGVNVAAVDDVVRWLHDVDATFSPYLDDSPISAIGRGDIALDQTTEQIRRVLAVCDWARIETGGVFDVWNVPAPNGTRFDPSGYVKGWSIEEAAAILEQHGCRDFSINGGGDVVVRGRPEPKGRWRVGIRHPSVPDAVAKVVEVVGPAAVATSGTYERPGHIIDPGTNRPADRLASATVVGPDLGIADIFATTVLIMGTDGLEWLEGRDGYEGYVITTDGDTMWTPGFNRYLTSANRGG
jgi:thiamine biosynthesis lipoprotein